jgi:hypothetical protein
MTPLSLPLLALHVLLPVAYLALQFIPMGRWHPAPPRPPRRQWPELALTAAMLGFPAVAYGLLHKPWMQLSLFLYGVFLISELAFVWWPVLRRRLGHTSAAPAAATSPAHQPGTDAAPAADASRPGRPEASATGSWARVVFLALLVGALGASWAVLSATPDSACVFCVRDVG